MTDVDGPLGLLERFSSPFIRGRDGDVAATAGELGLAISCDMARVVMARAVMRRAVMARLEMARAFGTGVRHPHGKPEGGQWILSDGATPRASHQSRSRIPAGPTPSGSMLQNMVSLKPFASTAWPEPGALRQVRFPTGRWREINE